MFKYILLITAALIMTSCGEENGQKQVEAKQDTLDSWQETGDGKHLRLADFTLTAPSNWLREQPESNMRIVQYKVQGNEELKVAGFYFGEQEGMEQANIERWKKEFTNITDTASETLDNDIQFIEISGTFKRKPFPMAQEFEETPGYSTLAAIVPSAEGPYYFKLVGPKEKIAEEESNFKEFLNSYKKVK